MSTTIDQKVVEMKFDNKQFENNVQTSMSTLEKLKQSLKLDGAVKGLENVNTAAKNFNMSGMDNSIETVRTKFSALQVMGVTALANITNSAINAGKRITSALAIEPIMSGFSEYELKIDSIRTIMASTGESIETVNKYLDELNTYSDRTIYSFSDMTENIGKFTNAGVKLEDAVLAIKGISNEAAVSGANADEASRAMYNFAQALSSGSVKLIDWKSIELANMATLEFKNELLKTAEAIGTVVKINGQYKTTTTNAKGEVSDLFTATSNFNESLNHQWMTTDVLVQTLARYSDETTEIGRKAYASAEEVTKLTQMFDVLKETAQSGWSKTWELIFGDAEQAKAIFTPLTKILSDIIQASSDFRNNLIEGALNSPFGQLAKKIENATVKTEKIVKVTKDYSDVVNKVINGDFGTGEDRFKKLTKAGYDWAYIQNLVNEKLGDGTRHATKFKEEQKNLTEVQQTTIEQLTKMSDAQLKNLDFTEEEISAFRELAKQSEKTGIPIQDLINNLDLLDSYTLKYVPEVFPEEGFINNTGVIFHPEYIANQEKEPEEVDDEEEEEEEPKEEEDEEEEEEEQKEEEKEEETSPAEEVNPEEVAPVYPVNPEEVAPVYPEEEETKEVQKEEVNQPEEVKEEETEVAPIAQATKSDQVQMQNVAEAEPVAVTKDS